MNRLEEILQFNKEKHRTGFYALLMIGIAALLFGFALMYKGSGEGFGFLLVFLGWFLTAIYYTFVTLIITLPSENKVVELSVAEGIENIIHDATIYRLSKNEVKMLKKVLKKVDGNNN